MKKLFKRQISMLLALILMIGMIPPPQKAEAAKQRHYAYLVSVVSITITRDKTTGAITATHNYSGGGSVKGTINTSAKTATFKGLTIGTAYNSNCKIANLPHKSTGRVLAPDGSFNSSRFYTGADNASARQYPTAEIAIGQKVNKPVCEYIDSGWGFRGNKYTVDFILKNLTNYAWGSTTVINLAAVLEYQSVDEVDDSDYGGGGGGGGDSGGGEEWPDPEPEPEPDYPSVPRVAVSISKPANMYLNYKNLSGNISASATARDNSVYNDYGSFKNVQLSFSGLGDSEIIKSTTSTSVSLTLSNSLSQINTWAWRDSDYQYSYDLIAQGAVNLTQVGGDLRDVTDTGYVTLENGQPSIAWNMRTNDLNGGVVQPNYFYTNTPITLDVKFNDPESDIYYSYLALGPKAIMDTKKAYLVYSNEQTSSGTPIEKELISEGLIEVVSITKGISGYKATIIFKEPGLYSYDSQLLDANSNASLRRESVASGTFIVRSDPAAPTALISSPTFAFENEPFNVTQASTDPNGVDDIVQYTWTPTSDVTAEADPEAAEAEGFTEITNVVNSWPGNGTVAAKAGGKLTFPTGSAHHYFKIGLDIKDATNLTDSTTQVIKVVSNVPVGSLTTETDISNLKENRKVVVTAKNSIAPSSSPIQWDKTEWKVEAISGGTDANIHIDETQTDGNKQRVLQFDAPGVYKVTMRLHNTFSAENPDHEDIGASTATLFITVVEDRAPISNVVVTSGKPDFISNPSTHTVSFRVSSYSDDGDIITAPTSYSWVIYDDINNDGIYSEDERIPESKITYNAEKTEVSVPTTYGLGKHNKIKAEVTTTESFAEPTLTQFLSADGSHIRKTTVSTVETVNWIPKNEILPPDASNHLTPYEEADIDGDTVIDGKFIKAYTDDTFSVGVHILDEFPETTRVTWELHKKDHNGAYSKTTSSGGSWIQSSYVYSTLGHDGGTLRINSSGIYMLKMIVKDDYGDTSEHTIMIRIYTLPQALLESNPSYLLNSDLPWHTKENIRFDLRSNPSIVDDEWGKAWHTMDWSKDNWDVKPLDGQDISEIHFMDPEYIGRYNDAIPSDITTFSGRNSALGFGQLSTMPIDIIVMPGLLGQVVEGHPYQLDTTEMQQLISSSNTLANTINGLDPRYNVKVYEAPVRYDSNDLFRTPVMYGYFDGFVNTQENEENRYTIEYTSEPINGGVGSSGITRLTGNVTKMNKDEAEKECRFGALTVMAGYDSTHPELANEIFKGSCKVYCNEVLIAELDATTNYMAAVKVADMERLEDDSWKITGLNGTTVNCTTETNIKTRVEYTGVDCGDYLSLVLRGWCGIYDDKYDMVTHTKTIKETLEATNFRPNALKILVYATNNYGSNPEFNATTDVKNNEVCQSLIDYLIANQIHLISITPPNMVTTMSDVYTELTQYGNTYGEGYIYGGSIPTYINTNVHDYIMARATLTDDSSYRSCAFTEPGRYSITYWGTNYGGKVTLPVTYTIDVEPDLAPIISGNIADKFLRDSNDLYNGKYRALIAVTGPYSSKLNRDVLTITSPDGDYIDHTKVKLVYDANNNKLFTDTGVDMVWANLPETTGTQLGDIYYVLTKLVK